MSGQNGRLSIDPSYRQGGPLSFSEKVHHVLEKGQKSSFITLRFNFHVGGEQGKLGDVSNLYD